MAKAAVLCCMVAAGAALAPSTRTPRRRSVKTCMLEEGVAWPGEVVHDDLETLKGLDIDALVAGAGFTVASTQALADAGGAVPEMAMDLSGGKSAPLAAGELLAFERDGHLCTRKLFSSAEVAAMRASLEAVSRVEAQTAQRHAIEMNDARGGEVAPFLQTFNPHRRHLSAMKVATCARLAATAQKLLGVEEVRLYQTCLFKKRAGDEPTGWHSDLHTSPLDTNQFVTAWFPLHDLAAESTGLCYATGSHRDLALPMWYGQGFDAEGRYDVADHGAYAAGDVSWHHGWLLHSAAENATPWDRLAVAVTFFASGARVIDGEGLSFVNDEDHPSYDEWLSNLAPGDVAAHALLPVVHGQVDEELEGLTVPALRDLCRGAGLMVGGKKAELVARLREHRARS